MHVNVGPIVAASLLALLVGACTDSFVPARDDASVPALADAGPACAPASEPSIDEVASLQQVRFHVHGTGQLAVGVGTYAWDSCSPWAIERRVDGAWEPVRLVTGYHIACEGLTPMAEVTYTDLSSTPTTVTWDAREVATWRECVSCESEGWPGYRDGVRVRGARRPVAAGRYRAVFQRGPVYYSGYVDAARTDLVPELCGFLYDPNNVAVEFDLPEGVAVDVDVDVDMLPTPTP